MANKLFYLEIGRARLVSHKLHTQPFLYDMVVSKINDSDGLMNYCLHTGAEASAVVAANHAKT